MQKSVIDRNTTLLSAFLAMLAVTLFVGATLKAKRPQMDSIAGYSLTIEPYTKSTIAPPKLPDLSGYTLEAVLKKLPPVRPGKIEVVEMVALPGLDEFSGPRYIDLYAKMQDTKTPMAITIRSGAYTLEMLVAAVNDPQKLERNGNIYTLRLPLNIEYGATLIVSEGTTLRLSKTHGGIIANSGLFSFIGSEMVGWDEEKNTYSFYKDKKDFRPFFATWNGAEAYLVNSKFMHLGYPSSKAYGITYSSTVAVIERKPNLPAPTGWLIGSYFEGIYYGFYSYEADDVVLLDNHYHKNIVYGIDPHDRSNRLIIARNLATDTIVKHGIIVSREVNDSFIIHNRSYNNHGTGIMVDRNSERNVVAYNESNSNRMDGITLFESPHTFLYNNWVSENGKVGLRIRNSDHTVALNNTITKNKSSGIKVYAQILINDGKSEFRDFILDPYKTIASLTIEGGTVSMNGSGDFRADQVRELDIRNVNVISESFLREPLDVFAPQAFEALQKGNARLLFVGQSSDHTPQHP